MPRIPKESSQVSHQNQKSRISFVLLTTTARATAATIQDLKFEYLPIFLICDYHLLGQSNVEVIQGLCTLVALLLFTSIMSDSKEGNPSRTYVLRAFSNLRRRTGLTVNRPFRKALF